MWRMLNSECKCKFMRRLNIVKIAYYLKNNILTSI